MKCYYPIDSAGNRIGFKTPEACVYDASGTSLTTKLAQINSNISKKANASHTHAIGDINNLQNTINSINSNISNKFTFKSGTISSNDTSHSTSYISYYCINKIVFIIVSGQYTLTPNQPVNLYTLPHRYLYPAFGFNALVSSISNINIYFESSGDQYIRAISIAGVSNFQIYSVFSYISQDFAS